jgi:peptidoglycan/xylan/chitin deacetylase (PgdA/CDA1 family)
MLKWLSITALLFVCLVAAAWGGWRLSNSRTHQLAGELVRRVDTSDSVVALTFDDGPIPSYTDSVLATLAEFDVPATFFMVGSAIERNPEVVRRVVAQGHELGNHSYTHRQLVLKLPATIAMEIETTDSLIHATGQTGEIFVRPPYGKRLLTLPLYLARRGRPIVLWDLEPDTYRTRADGMTQYVLERVQPGSIILLHVEIPSRREGRAALQTLVPELQSRGFRFVTLSELMRRASTP